MSLKMFFHRRPYFMWYILKSPIMDIFSLFKSIKVEKKEFRKMFRPKVIFFVLLMVNLMNIIFGYYDFYSKILYVLLILVYIWKMWISGDDIRDRKEKIMNKILPKSNIQRNI